MTILDDVFEKRRAELERRRSAVRDWIRLGLALASLVVSLFAIWQGWN